MAERFIGLGAGIVGHVGALPAVGMVVDLLGDRILVLSPGKPPEWRTFAEFVMDRRGMKTGEDLERDQRGF